MYLLLDVGEIFFLVHVILDIGMAVSSLFGGMTFPGEVS